MNYKKKLAILAVVVVVLALVYVFSQIFNPERMNSRNSMFTWLDPKVAAGAEKITVTKDAASINLIKQGGVWFVLNNNIQYPAKQSQIT
ncbi:MAG: hypothetical protein FWF29_09535, partial [Treponema sp.]|nr:hypothetical protein [Treponema sp.]